MKSSTVSPQMSATTERALSSPFRLFEQVAASLGLCIFASPTPSLQAPDASARLGRGTVVEPGAVLGAGVVIGDFVLVGARAILGPGAAVGDYAFVGGGGVVGAGARLGGGCVLGMGAAVLPDRAVGACATVLVASVVYDDVPERAVAAGVPAAPLGASRRTRVA